jgi:hypothetical protein
MFNMKITWTGLLIDNKTHPVYVSSSSLMPSGLWAPSYPTSDSQAREHHSYPRLTLNM